MSKKVNYPVLAWLGSIHLFISDRQLSFQPAVLGQGIICGYDPQVGNGGFYGNCQF